MSNVELAKRLATLEAEVARLKAQVESQAPSKQPWWERIAGRFANDPIYDEAMRLGREYRESLRPVAKKGGKRRGNSRH
jgi:hypothetical protein